MNILVTTGIFPPESGGPATLTPLLASELVNRGHRVKVITYADEGEDADNSYDFEVIRIIRKGKLSNYFRYFLAVFKEVSSFDLVYSLDWFSAGVPVSLACRLKRKRYVVRLGGDYGWERYLDWGGKPLSICEFYERGIYKEGKMKIFFSLIKRVLGGAQMNVFNSDIQKELYEGYYHLDSTKTAVIHNPIPNVERRERNIEKKIIFAGRLEIKNNVSLLVDAFAKARLPGFKLIIIGDGLEEENLKKRVSDLNIDERVTFIPRVSREEVLEYLEHAYCVVLPSWTDVSPNLAYEALSLGVPVLISNENYLPFREKLFSFNPHLVAELIDLMEKLGNPAVYKEYTEDIRSIQFSHALDNFVDMHEDVFVRTQNL